MSEVTVILRTADRTRKAEVTVPRDQTGADLIQSALSNWSLPSDTEYSLVNVTKQRTLQPERALSNELVADRDELEIQPVLVAGIRRDGLCCAPPRRLETGRGPGRCLWREIAPPGEKW
jgi:hypothetical protein